MTRRDLLIRCAALPFAVRSLANPIPLTAGARYLSFALEQIERTRKMLPHIIRVAETAARPPRHQRGLAPH